MVAQREVGGQEVVRPTFSEAPTNMSRTKNTKNRDYSNIVLARYQKTINSLPLRQDGENETYIAVGRKEVLAV